MDRQPGCLMKLVSEVAAELGSITFRPVHVQRQAHDKFIRAMGSDGVNYGLKKGGTSGDLENFDWHGRARAFVADGDAGSLVSEVDGHDQHGSAKGVGCGIRQILDSLSFARGADHGDAVGVDDHHVVATYGCDDMIGILAYGKDIVRVDME